MTKRCVWGTVLACGLAMLPSALATPITFTGSSGPLSASATFNLSGSTLSIQLVNTGAAASVPTNVLMALFWDYSGSGSLTPTSASLAGSTVSYGTIVHNVGEGWVYAGGLSYQGANSGISAAGLGLFGSTGFFYSSPVTPLDGLNYGIANGFNSPNAGITGHGPIISNEIDFALGVPVGFRLNQLGNVVFQWGTATDEPSAPGILVPDGGATVALLGLALVALVGLRRRSRRVKAVAVPSSGAGTTSRAQVV